MDVTIRLNLSKISGKRTQTFGGEGGVMYSYTLTGNDVITKQIVCEPDEITTVYTRSTTFGSPVFLMAVSDAEGEWGWYPYNEVASQGGVFSKWAAKVPIIFGNPVTTPLASAVATTASNGLGSATPVTDLSFYNPGTTSCIVDVMWMT